MNIDYFREFIVLAGCGSYIEASERLFIGQSSLSKHIMSMEKELGVPLFERTSREAIRLQTKKSCIWNSFKMKHLSRWRKTIPFTS